MKPKILDACCRMGGSSRGYQLAGLHVIGVDELDCSEGYAGDEFIQGDAVAFIREHGHKFDAIHAGPPCQGQIRITKGNRKREGWSDNHVNLIPEMRAALEAIGRPWVIENGPSEHLRSDIELCGLMFDLPILRHRAFEIGGWSARPERGDPAGVHRVVGDAADRASVRKGGGMTSFPEIHRVSFST